MGRALRVVSGCWLALALAAAPARAAVVWTATFETGDASEWMPGTNPKGPDGVRKNFEVLGETEPYRAALVVIAATKRMSGRWTHYQCDAGAGTRVAFVIEHPLFVLPPADLARTLRVLTEGVSGGEIRDHRPRVALLGEKNAVQAVHDRHINEP
jgi:hypothetical protein